jgi:uncharacterized protein (TIGR02594 family)
MNVLDIQTRLKALGFDSGPLDGLPGRRTTAAVEAFQKAKGLEPDGVVGPKTLGALNGAVGAGSPSLPALTPSTIPPWLVTARSKMGLTEGNASALAKLKAFLKSDGHTLGDPSKLPWCGDFVETCIALTCPKESMIVNPYYALNWAKFGVLLTGAAIGEILVFKREGGGHVGFYVGEDATRFRVLGGNQSNSVSETWVAKNRLYARRWPSTYPLPSLGAVTVSAAGATSTNEA